MNYSDWGSEHPDGKDPLKVRAVWTNSELLYVYNFTSMGKIRRTPDDVWKAICMDADARRIFHPNHVMNKSRITHALKEVKKAAVLERILEFEGQEIL